MSEIERDLYLKLQENWRQFTPGGMLVSDSLGATNHVYRLTTEPAYYLRKYRTNNVARIQNEHELLVRLSEQLVFIVSPCLTRSDSTFANINGHYYALFPQANGRLVDKNDLSKSHAFQLGKTLALLHIALSPFTSDNFPTITLAWDKDNWLHRLRKIIAAIDSETHSEVDYWALRRAQQQLRYLQSSEAVHCYAPTTPRQLIHGDFHHLNIFFDSKSNVSGVIDWDLMQNMPPGYEIARACMYMFNMDVCKSVEMLKGYMSVKPLTRLELNDGAQAWGVFADHHVWALEAVYLQKNMSAQKFIPQTDFSPFMAQWLPIEYALFCKSTPCLGETHRGY